MERKLTFFEGEIKKEKEDMLVEKGKKAEDLEGLETVALFPEDQPEKKGLTMDEMEVYLLF
jgi:hypothetical protein